MIEINCRTLADLQARFPVRSKNCIFENLTQFPARALRNAIYERGISSRFTARYLPTLMPVIARVPKIGFPSNYVLQLSHVTRG